VAEIASSLSWTVNYGTSISHIYKVFTLPEMKDGKGMWKSQPLLKLHFFGTQIHHSTDRQPGPLLFSLLSLFSKD
jgi:hypothetical protein